jgi:ferrous iron transport protein B
MQLATQGLLPHTLGAPETVVVVGKESVGKSQLIGSLTRSQPATANVRGTTVSCEVYSDGERSYVDTPGILRESDSLTTKLALRELSRRDAVLLVVSATHLDDDLAELLPLAHGKLGAVAVTFWDMASRRAEARPTLERLAAATGLVFVPVDARHLTATDRAAVHRALDAPRPFPAEPAARAGWTIAPRRNLFDLPVVGQLVALLLLFAPSWLAVVNANRVADALYPGVSALLAPVLATVARWPAPLSNVLGGDYGFIAMGPFLFLYAGPTVLLFALLIAVYKASGLIDRLTVSLDPVVRPFGLAGRDLVRVVMGFGCNVPAVINSRACSACSRGACVSAIAFGSACSYQLPATLAVFAAAHMERLAFVYLALLAATTLIYLRLTVPAAARRQTNRLKLVGRDFLQWPTLASVRSETWRIIRQFFFLALPVFVLICAGAALLEWSGALAWLSRALAPLMALFHLPGEAAVAVVLGSIRKDGIAIGLLNPGWQTLKVPLATPAQVLTAVYLAGVLLPCLVTQVTVVREMSFRFAWRMAGRQMLAAALFSLLIAWGGALLVG